MSSENGLAEDYYTFLTSGGTGIEREGAGLADQRSECERSLLDAPAGAFSIDRHQTAQSVCE